MEGRASLLASSVLRARLMVLRKFGWVLVLGVAMAGCASDEEGDDGGGSNAALARSCHDSCDAQAAVVGCMLMVTPETCNALCDSNARELPDECADSFTAYYDCTVATGYECQGAYVLQRTAECDDEVRTLGTCLGNDMECEGADETGACPSVECQCPSGPKRISAVSYESGSCVCVDATTCVELC